MTITGYAPTQSITITIWTPYVTSSSIRSADHLPSA
jgi:hypothetical protein